MAGNRLFVIDFLQSIDFSSRVNRHTQLEKAKPLLMRDLQNLERFFGRYAATVDAATEYERPLSLVEV